MRSGLAFRGREEGGRRGGRRGGFRELRHGTAGRVLVGDGWCGHDGELGGGAGSGDGGVGDDFRGDGTGRVARDVAALGRGGFVGRGGADEAGGFRVFVLSGWVVGALADAGVIEEEPACDDDGCGCGGWDDP